MVPDEGPTMQVGYEGNLEPCPFCGSKQCRVMAEQVSEDGDPDSRIVYWVDCQGCGATGPVKLKAPLAAEQWNTRQ